MYEGTSIKLLSSKLVSGLVKGVSLDINEQTIQHSIDNTYPGVKVTRFIKKDGTKLHTVRLDFENADHLDLVLEKGIYVSHSHFTVEKFMPKKKVIQCFNCKKFNHPAKWCKYKHVCTYCSEEHNEDICTTTNSSTTKYKCSNCGEKHPSNSHACIYYLEQMDRINNPRHYV